MAPSSFVYLFTVLSLAFLTISFDALHVNALAVEPARIARGVNHAGIAKKRSASKHCKPRPIPSALQSVSSAPVTTSHHPTAHGNAAMPTPSSQLSTYKTTTMPPSSTPSAAASSGGSCGSQKVGIAWSNNEEQSLPNFVTPCTHYISNWQLSTYDTSVTSTGAYRQLEFVPTIHDASAISQISLLKRGYAKKVKGFNEANIASQANMDPVEACNLWMQHINPLISLGYELIGPSVTTDVTGHNWLTKFMDQCGHQTTISRHDLHFYGLHSADLISAVNQFHTDFGLDLWIGEIGCVDYSPSRQPCTQSVFDQFYAEAVNFLESTSFVEMYAWFGLFRPDELPNGVDQVNSMITCPDPSDLSKCRPNALGSRYLNAAS